jgi:peptide/nickel transport system permease protein
MSDVTSASTDEKPLVKRVWSSHLTRFALTRFLQAIPVLVGVTLITFGMMNLLPGGSAVALAGDNPTPQVIAVLNRELGLNKPFFERYWDWLSQVLSGHLGSSMLTREPIAGSLGGKLPVTIELIILSLVVSLGLAIPVAVLSAHRPNGVVDRLSAVVSMVGVSMPQFVTGLLLILIFAVHIRVLPATGFASISAGPWTNLRTMILPVATLSFGLFSIYSRLLRGDLRDEMLGEDYITVAKSKGCSEWRVLLNHALRNAGFNLLTLVGLNVGTLLGGTVIVESIFALPGVGQDLIGSITSRDQTTVEAIVLILATTVVVANFLTDLLYSVLDPRIRYGREPS